MKKLLLYSLTLVGMLVSSTQFAFAQLKNPDFKEIKSSTGSFFLKTSQTVLGAANTDNWAADGTGSGTFSPGGDKSAAYNPETGANNFEIKKEYMNKLKDHNHIPSNLKSLYSVSNDFKSNFNIFQLL